MNYKRRHTWLSTIDACGITKYQRNKLISLYGLKLVFCAAVDIN